MPARAQKWLKPMSAAVSPSEPVPTTGLRNIRADGGVAVAARAESNLTVIDALYEYGGYRVKCPSSRAATLEAVMINTGGGVAGGDRISISAHAAAQSRLSLTTATAERIYRSDGSTTEIDVTLSVDDDATLAWLPQATILFSGAAASRRLTANLTTSSRLLITEMTAYGRIASGEVMRAGAFSDQWRVLRNGSLVFAESTRLDGDIATTLSRPAVAAGASLSALLLCVAPDVEAGRDDVRSALAAHRLPHGVSAWNGLLTARILSHRLDHLANALRSAVAALAITPLPAAWTH